MLKDTIFTDISVSAPNFEENIVVIAAEGALQEITEEISIVPLIPQRYIMPKAAPGNITSFIAIAIIHFRLLIPFKRLLCAK